MKMLKFFNIKVAKKEGSKFSSFLLNASDAKKEKVFIDAARKANKEQREIFDRSSLKIKTG